jgi:glycosyltransferase involved in cell wall biosynthesis
LDSFQMILIDDGSSDRTGAVMDELAASNPEITVIHHPQPRGVGMCYREGLALANLDKVTLIPGDHNCEPITWEPIFRALDTADIVIGYRVNQGATRPLHRVILSNALTWMCGLLFGVWLKDFHGLAIYPIRDVKDLDLKATSYGYQMEMLVQLHRRRLSVAEVPLYLTPEELGTSRSLRLRTLREIIRMILRLTFNRSPAKSPRPGDSKQAGENSCHDV